jgi:hypothetical protein
MKNSAYTGTEPAIKVAPDYRFQMAERPRGYGIAAPLLMSLWILGCLIKNHFLPTADPSAQNLLMLIGQGTAGVFIVLLLVFGLHCVIKALRNDRSNLARRNAWYQWMDLEAVRTFSLEIQGTGVGLNGQSLQEFWATIDPQNPAASIPVMASAPLTKPEPAPSEQRQIRLNRRGAFRGAAAKAVTCWPIPTFIVSASDIEAESKEPCIGHFVNQGRNAAVLGVTLFISEHQEQSHQAQSTVERLFDFMDKRACPAQCLMVSDESRSASSPTAQKNTMALLLGCSYRLKFIEQHATHAQQKNHELNTDLGKLWAWYWKCHRDYNESFIDASLNDDDVRHPMHTLSSAYWQANLAELRNTLDNSRKGFFTSDPWLPIRWTPWQVEAFKSTPLLGHLHRPISVAFKPEADDVSVATENTQRFKHGWIEALNSLPEGARPVRVFYDSTDNLSSIKALGKALRALSPENGGLDLANPHQGHDIAQRIGDVGVGSALLLINLATIASYPNGGISAVVYRGDEHRMTIQMVRPPSKERQQRNGDTVESFSFKPQGTTT